MVGRFLVIVAIYSINKAFKAYGIGNAFTFYHLSDLLFVPFVIASTGLMFLVIPSISYRTNWSKEIYISTVVAIFLFELLQPMFDKTATGDLIDCAMYVLGGLMSLVLYKNLKV
jgi:hypothetical protein